MNAVLAEHKAALERAAAILDQQLRLDLSASLNAGHCRQP